MGKGGTKGGFMKNGRIEDEGEQTEESFFFHKAGGWGSYYKN
mgnify:CR=1 FL=1